MKLDIGMRKAVTVLLLFIIEVVMRLIRLKEVLNKTGLSKATLYRLISDGQFPTSIKIAYRAVGWEESLVDEWLRSKVSRSNFEQDKAEIKNSPHYVHVGRRVDSFAIY